MPCVVLPQAEAYEYMVDFADTNKVRVGVGAGESRSGQAISAETRIDNTCSVMQPVHAEHYA